MIYKTTSIKRVIAKVFTDLNLQEETHRISDFIEWGGEALEKIGAFPQFINKVTGKDGCRILVLENYQCQLPNDFHRLIQMSYSENPDGPFYPMRYATGSFDAGSNDNKDFKHNHFPVFADADLVVMAMDLYDMPYDEAHKKINDDPIFKAKIGGLMAQLTKKRHGEDEPLNTTKDKTYLINGGFIKTNQRTGFIQMAYQAIPTDNEGYPLVPDDVSFLEAIYWYIVMKLYYPKWVQGSIRDEVYYDARRSWNFHCKQAYGNALLPNADQLESIKNEWNRLKPELHEWSTGFSTMGERQIIYDNN
jgi:hypothetical protein